MVAAVGVPKGVPLPEGHPEKLTEALAREADPEPLTEALAREADPEPLTVILPVVDPEGDPVTE